MTILLDLLAAVSLNMPGNLHKVTGNENNSHSLFFGNRIMKKQNGHTLIELVFVIVLIGIAFPGLLAFFTNSVVDSVKNEIINKAIVLARVKMEEIAADKQNADRGIMYIKTSNRYPTETLDQYVCSVSVQDNSIDGVDGINVEVSVIHPLLQNTYTLTHFFTNQDVY